MILIVKNRIIERTTTVLIIAVLLVLLFTGCSKKVVGEVTEESLPEDTVENISEIGNLTNGNSLKVGDYIQFGNYQVENEGYNPILWIVIDNNSHYSNSVNPAVKFADFAVEEGGYWRLNSKWTLHLTDKFSTFNNNSILATAWSRY